MQTVPSGADGDDDVVGHAGLAAGVVQARRLRPRLVARPHREVAGPGGVRRRQVHRDGGHGARGRRRWPRTTGTARTAPGATGPPPARVSSGALGQREPVEQPSGGAVGVTVRGLGPGARHRAVRGPHPHRVRVAVPAARPASARSRSRRRAAARCRAGSGSRWRAPTPTGVKVHADEGAGAPRDDGDDRRCRRCVDGGGDGGAGGAVAEVVGGHHAGTRGWCRSASPVKVAAVWLPPTICDWPVVTSSTR